MSVIEAIISGIAGQQAQVYYHCSVHIKLSTICVEKSVVKV